MRRLTPLLVLLALLSACAPQAARLASAARPRPVWGFLQSDIPPEPQYRFNRLPNGLRYIIRRNANPKGTAMVRMEIAAGSLDEGPTERGFAHFVEHMAFNGSTNVPEGEMVRLLERNGLAFGADTNASTGFEATTYMLDLPRADPKLLDVALMLMRETATELTITPEAVARERGVILAKCAIGIPGRCGTAWIRPGSSIRRRSIPNASPLAWPRPSTPPRRKDCANSGAANTSPNMRP